MPQFWGVMVRMAKGDNVFKAPKAEIVTTDPAKFLAWVERMESMGYVEVAEHEEFINMLRAMRKKRDAELSKPYDPTPEQVAADRANKPSGKDQKPFRKPVRDYQGNPKPGPWERVLPAGPKEPKASTKRFPHLGGQTGPQSRGE